MPHSRFILSALTACLVASCTSTEPMPTPEPDGSVYGDRAPATASPREGLGGGELIDYDPAAGELASIIYFDFDSSEVRPGDTNVVSRHAALLVNDSRLRVRLEGHADERGSREYNIGLGERRSQAVRRLLLIQGVAVRQISTVSFGEERPAAMGSDEEAYALNRRVEFRYEN